MNSQNKGGTKQSDFLPLGNKLSVNLLPQEVLLERKQSSKLSLINKISIVALVILMIITSTVFALRIFQGASFKKAKGKHRL